MGFDGPCYATFNEREHSVRENKNEWTFDKQTWAARQVEGSMQRIQHDIF